MHQFGEKNNRSLLCERAFGESLPTVSIVSLSSIRSWALGISMCMRSVCCCLLIGSAGRVFLLQDGRGRKQQRSYVSCNFSQLIQQLILSKFSPHQHLSQTFCIYKRRRYTYLYCLGKKWRLKRVALQSPSAHLEVSWAFAPFFSVSAPTAR